MSTQSHFEFVYSAANSQRLLCSQKACVKVRIKAFWYRNYIKIGFFFKNMLQIVDVLQ